MIACMVAPSIIVGVWPMAILHVSVAIKLTLKTTLKGQEAEWFS